MRAAVEPRRRAGLQPAHREGPAPYRRSDRPIAGASPTRPAGMRFSPIWMTPLQERAGGQHDGARAPMLAADRP